MASSQLTVAVPLPDDSSALTEISTRSDMAPFEIEPAHLPSPSSSQVASEVTGMTLTVSSTFVGTRSNPPDLSVNLALPSLKPWSDLALLVKVSRLICDGRMISSSGRARVAEWVPEAVRTSSFASRVVMPASTLMFMVVLAFGPISAISVRPVTFTPPVLGGLMRTLLMTESFVLRRVKVMDTEVPGAIAPGPRTNEPKISSPPPISFFSTTRDGDWFTEGPL
mmetsp:Transcript_25522/g.68456  ORF Transcript_25522/g.68456 Transcript_25522/m.68456 type:complete len:224 (+) Transcript_25522:225-896(+)